jgi:hypothetical protein
MGYDEKDEGNAGSALRRLIRYLAEKESPRRVATRNIAKGFQHGRTASQYKNNSITSVNQLSEALGYRNHSSLYPANHKLSNNTAVLIRALYSIEENSDCWVSFRRYDFQGFVGAYESLHCDKTVEAPPNRAQLVQLQWDASAENTGGTTRYASLALRTGNSPTDPLPGQIHLGFDLHCPLDETDKVVTGLKRCFLIFDCGGGYTGPLSTRTGNAGGVEFDGARFSTFGTSITEPVWEITAKGPGVIGKVESVPPTFICIDSLKSGSTVKARVRAPVKEILTTFVVPEGVGQSAAKQKIKARLQQLGIMGGEDGEADLALNEIKLMARSDATNPDPED